MTQAKLFAYTLELALVRVQMATLGTKNIHGLKVMVSLMEQAIAGMHIAI